MPPRMSAMMISLAAGARGRAKAAYTSTLWPGSSGPHATRSSRPHAQVLMSAIMMSLAAERARESEKERARESESERDRK
jgi:hypothetical protein